MTHLAITEQLDGTRVQWMEQVSDAQYNAPPSSSAAQAPSAPAPTGSARPSGPLQQKVAPGMAALTDDVLYGDVWNRRELSPRDRSLVTITSLIALGKTAPLSGHLGRALDNGLKPGEASALLAHLAVYCGWPSAVAALDAYDQVYTARKIDTAALGTMGPRLPAPASDAARAGAANEALARVAPKFAQLTNDVVFGDLWRRSDLSLRDRSLVTIVALAAMGDADQLGFYLSRGIESGLTQNAGRRGLHASRFLRGLGKGDEGDDGTRGGADAVMLRAMERSCG